MNRPRRHYHHTPRRPVAPEEASDHIRLLMKLRTSGIRDPHVLDAMESIPRGLFVDETFREHAWDDTALPLACGQTISQPTIVAWMTSALKLEPQMRVLEVGTGSGYQAAILSKLARRVYTIERHEALLSKAEERFKTLRLTNIVTKLGDGSKGWKEAAPFDRIIVTAAAERMPETLLSQLAPGGIMVLPIESQDGQVLLSVSKAMDGAITTQQLMNVRFVPLVEE